MFSVPYDFYDLVVPIFSMSEIPHDSKIVWTIGSRHETEAKLLTEKYFVFQETVNMTGMDFSRFKTGRSTQPAVDEPSVYRSTETWWNALRRLFM